jgi:hypothetical protein
MSTKDVNIDSLPTSRDVRRTFNATLDKAIAAPVYFKRNETVFVLSKAITEMTYDDYNTYEISPEFLKEQEERRNRIFGDQV